MIHNKSLQLTPKDTSSKVESFPSACGHRMLSAGQLNSMLYRPPSAEDLGAWGLNRALSFAAYWRTEEW
jgi:hypothetical protein